MPASSKTPLPPVAKASKPDDKTVAARIRYAKRLVALREDYSRQTGQPDLGKDEFAKLLGVEPERYRRYERAETEPPLWLQEQILQLANTTADMLIGKPSSKPQKIFSPAEMSVICKRIRAVRGAMIEHVRTDAQFAQLCEVDVETLGCWLNEECVPTVKEATRLCEKTGLNLDFIFRGKWEGLEPAVAIRLKAMLDKVPLAAAAPKALGTLPAEAPCGLETGGAKGRRAVVTS